MGTLSKVSFLLLALPQATRAADLETATGDIPSIVELVGSIVDAARALEGLLLFLILIAVVGVMAVILHLWHQRDAITLSLFALLMFAVGVAAYLTRDARHGLEEASQSRLFLPLGESRTLGPFNIRLADVDTLKAKGEDGEVDPWAFNLTFGQQALFDFFQLGKTRLQADFVTSADAISRWPTGAEVVSIAKTADARQWKGLVDRLEIDIDNRQTERTVELKKAFSKWPLVELQIRDVRTDEMLVNRYFPDRSVVVLRDNQGSSYRIDIETVFNGDRDLGEAEACVLRVREVGEAAAQQAAAAAGPSGRR